MNYAVERACGHVEGVTFHGTQGVWKSREELLKRLPCSKCHTERLRKKVLTSAPSLSELTGIGTCK